MRERIKKKELLSNGSLLWRKVFLDWLFPFVHHGLGDLFSRGGGREDVK
jgi:hypothetical protein